MVADGEERNKQEVSCDKHTLRGIVDMEESVEIQPRIKEVFVLITRFQSMGNSQYEQEAVFKTYPSLQDIQDVRDGYERQKKETLKKYPLIPMASMLYSRVEKRYVDHWEG